MPKLSRFVLHLLLPAILVHVTFGLKSKSEYRVHGLEDVEVSFAAFDGEMYAGMVPMDTRDGPNTGEYMFWLFAPEQLHPRTETTMVVWLNGGPGCTSFNAGLLFETAPVTTGPLQPGSCCIDPNAPLRPNPYAWTKSTTMLYVEQPAGTGFSKGPMPRNEEELSKAMHSFLVNFMTIFDEYEHHRLFFFGESYAGMYVPSIAHQIYVENQNPDTPMVINLAGIGLGNGLIDVTQQTTPMIDYAYFHGLIDSKQRHHFYNEWEHCYTPGKEDAMQPEPEPYHSFNIPDECGIMSAIAEAAGRSLIPGKALNVYDVTSWDPYASLSHVQHGAVQDSTNTRFMNDPRVKEALHAPTDTFWMGCMPGQGRRRRLKQHYHDKGSGSDRDDDYSIAYDDEHSEEPPPRDDGDDDIRNEEEDRHRPNEPLLPLLPPPPLPPKAAERPQIRFPDHLDVPAEKLLDQDRPISMSPYIAELLDKAKIDVLVYNGDRDMACCAQGSEAVLDTMKWDGAPAWDKAQRGLWLVDGEMAGYAKKAQNLTFVVVFNSGHMVPTNQPVNALDLLTRFITRSNFLDKPTPSFAYHNISGTTTTTISKGSASNESSGMWTTPQLVSLLVFLAFGILGGNLLGRYGQKNAYAPIPDANGVEQ